MDEELWIDTDPELELNIEDADGWDESDELRDAEIDEELGKENTDHDGIGNSLLEEEESDSTPKKKRKPKDDRKKRESKHEPARSHWEEEGSDDPVESEVKVHTLPKEDYVSDGNTDNGIVSTKEGSLLTASADNSIASAMGEKPIARYDTVSDMPEQGSGIYSNHSVASVNLKGMNSLGIAAGAQNAGVSAYMAAENLIKRQNTDNTAVQGLQEVEYSVPVRMVGIMMRSGVSANYSIMDDRDKARVRAGQKVDELILEGHISVSDLKDKDARMLGSFLKEQGTSFADRREIVRYKSEIADLIELREEVKLSVKPGGLGEPSKSHSLSEETKVRHHKPDNHALWKAESHLGTYSREDIEFVSSRALFGGGDAKKLGQIIQKRLEAQGIETSVPISRLDIKGLKELEKGTVGLRDNALERRSVGTREGALKKEDKWTGERAIEKRVDRPPESIGAGAGEKEKGQKKLTDKDRRLIREYRRRRTKKEYEKRRVLGFPGHYRRMDKLRAMGKALGIGILSKDPSYAESIRALRTASAVGNISFYVGVTGAKVLGRVTGVSFITRKVGGKLKTVAVKSIRQVAAPVGNAVHKGAVHTRKAVSKVSRSVIGSIGKTAVGRTFHVVTGGIAKTGKAFSASKPVRIAVNTGKNTAKAGKAVAKGTSRAARIITMPIKGAAKIGEAFSFVWNKAKMAVGIAVIFFVGTYALISFLLNATRAVEAGLEGWGDSGTQLVGHLKERYESVIEYSHYKDMQDDIDDLLEMDEKTYEKAKELGEGHPITDEVLEGHTIDKYGCPDKEVGYYIHYMDAYGNEICSKASNVKDVEALCVAMVANEIGDYKNYKKDLIRFDDLLADMYELMTYHDPDTGLPFRYEESEIYTCLHGCDEYEYCCNDASAYATYEKYKADGCGIYEELEPFNAEGCESREVTVTKDTVSAAHGGENPDSQADADPSGTDDSGSEEVTITEHYCPGHSVPICYGHRDIDIYITLYDVEYAINENIYPDNWKTAKYRQMVQEFMKKGQWNSAWYAKIARNYLDGDWYELYGILIEGAEFSTGDPLTDDEIKKIIEEYGGDVTKARAALIQFGLQYVGRIGYQYGAKAGSGTPTALDCSGFVQWVFKQALGKTVPGSTAGYAGYKTKSYSDLKVGDLGFIFMGGSNAGTGTYNHVGIYCGKNAAGQDLWLHCSSGGGGVVLNTTTIFKKFVDPFAQ